MEQWLRDTFTVLPADPERGRSEDAFQFCVPGRDGHIKPVEAPVAKFIERFGSVPTPPTAASLKAADPDDLTGWHQHFDEWVRQGIIQP